MADGLLRADGTALREEGARHTENMDPRIVVGETMSCMLKGPGTHLARNDILQVQRGVVSVPV